MLLYQLGLLLLLLPVCSFAPGFFFLRNLRWNPLEKLCGSIGLSLILLYLASWGIYCVGARADAMPVHALGVTPPLIFIHGAGWPRSFQAVLTMI